MKIEVRYFAAIREALGPGEALDVPAGSNVGQVRDLLIARDIAHANALARGKAIRCALGQVICDEGAVVGEGAELAFFPPVTGG